MAIMIGCLPVQRGSIPLRGASYVKSIELTLINTFHSLGKVYSCLKQHYDT